MMGEVGVSALRVTVIGQQISIACIEISTRCAGSGAVSQLAR